MYITYDEKWGVQSTRLTELREICFPQSSVLQFPPLHLSSQRTASHHQCQLSISSLLIQLVFALHLDKNEIKTD